MKLNALEASSYLGELEKERMAVTDLTNRLGVAEEAVGTYEALVEWIREQVEDANSRCGAMEKERDEQLRRNRNNPELDELTTRLRKPKEGW